MAGFHIERYLIYFKKWVKSWLNFKIYQPMVFYVHCNQVTQTQTWYAKCNKTITALNFVRYDVLWSTEKQY